MRGIVVSSDMRYRIWLKATDSLPVEVEADSIQEAHSKVEQMLYLKSLWEEVSIDISEDEPIE